MDRETEKAKLATGVDGPGPRALYERHRLGNPVTMGSFERAASQYSHYPWLSETQEKVDAQPKQDAQSLLFAQREALVSELDDEGFPSSQMLIHRLVNVIDVLLLEVRRIDDLVAHR